ncbi:cobalamin B12-binding domain-containing protein [Hyphomonadaceae bacterium BL14]|nr:cobalamin B12-binding domain-containing protein [Hyphomonadaceae bacterium BL14]
MAQAEFDRFGLAGLARTTQASLDWKNWRRGTRPCDLDKAGPPKEVLDKLIEAEIIPRLMLINREAANAEGPARAPAVKTTAFETEQVNSFALRTVSSEPQALVDEVNGLLFDGATHEDVLLKLLAPAARHLGKLWEEDVCDFADVTIGLMKLHRVLERINADAPWSMGSGKTSPRVLLAPAPGEQHVFGIVMVGEFFARSGWRVRCESSPDMDHIVATVVDTHFDVVGLSASSDVKMKDLKGLIKLIRSRSQNPDIIILVGGQLFNEDMGLARRIGADATATDGVRAVVTAERLVHRLVQAS